MILLLHATIALTSLIATSTALMRPTKRLLSANYILIFLTIASGTLLVVTLQASMLHACISGLAYLAVSVTGTWFARQKLLAGSLKY